MSTDLHALVGHARWMPAEDRAVLAERWTGTPRTLLISTCHRVELFGDSEVIKGIGARDVPTAREISGSEVARHLVTVAVGRDSSVVAEDQILHQLRVATHHARTGAGLSTELDRLLDAALRAGRRARSWLPARRPTLADVALARIAPDSSLEGQLVLVIGSGEMGRAALATLASRRARVLVASRSAETARTVAERLGAEAVDFDPGADLVVSLGGVVIALNGRWVITDTTRAALVSSGAWVVDMSSPPAIDRSLMDALGERLTTIDDLADDDYSAAPSARVVARLDALVDDTVAEFESWQSHETRRSAADALAARAREVRSAELEELWQRAPSLEPNERAEVERALEHLTHALLRDPLEQLGSDGDGRHVRAARELFRL